MEISVAKIPTGLPTYGTVREGISAGSTGTLTVIGHDSSERLTARSKWVTQVEGHSVSDQAHRIPQNS